jgi:ankyrin repeat protein
MVEFPSSSSDSAPSPLSAAAARADVAAVRGLLADGAAVEGDPGEIDTPLFRVSDGDGPADDLEALLDAAPDGQRADALAMAVINGQRQAARLCLEAGADPNRFMPVHSHSTPLHQAAVNGDVSILQLLVQHGARLDIEDTLWRGTPLGWAIHNKQREAQAYLQALRNCPESDFRP